MRSRCLEAVDAGMRLKTALFGTFNALWPFAQSVSPLPADTRDYRMEILLAIMKALSLRIPACSSEGLELEDEGSRR
jgi:hypothetical protein